MNVEHTHLKIDIHTHIMPEKMPKWAEKFGYGGFISLDHHKPCCARMMKDDHFFREVQDNCWDPEARLKDCHHHSIDVQVLSTIPVLFNYWAKPKDCLEVSRFLNDHIASIVADYPDRFIGLGTVPLQDPDLAIKEMERCIKELGMAGIEIGSHVNGWNLDHEKLFPFFEAAEELGASLFVHPWDMMGQEKMPKYWLPWLVGMPAETSLAICSMIFGGVFERLPKLKVAFAHGGGSFPATIGRIEHGYNVRPDLCAVDNPINPKEYLGKFYLDSLVHDPQMLRYIVDLMGADRIALGTDYPFPLGELEPGKLIESMDDFSPELKRQLLSGTALDWLGLEKEQFIGVRKGII
ncbi:amidohydrolase family protein [Sediminitomix flava]|uniref:2-amino-3-carboxymuconate-6-semialdehyde decarboxylase n=1 Tax=Sediminitomix flava TaxID=379075 RepID=A0A315ZAM9_SEDFL|nr:amidohydrolase family protein [Sediminitomix flava]PWJ42113.1 aminocarboxymuconate-semialdehyde decarboxylase [Sediminitomix flava]